MPCCLWSSILVGWLLAVETSGYVTSINPTQENHLLQTSPSFQYHDRTDSECGFIGNSDIYGLGIRLGVYLQWLASYVSNTYFTFPLGHPDLLDGYLIFNSALLVALFVLTAKEPDTYSAEVLIVFFLIFNGWSTAFPIHRRERAVSIRDEFWEVGARSALTFTLNFIWAIYASWFWIAGVKSTFQATPCGTKVFIFSKVDMTPGAGGFLAARVVFGAASLFMTLAMSIAVLGGLVTHPKTFLSPISESVIWDLLLPTNRRGKMRGKRERRRQKGSQRLSEVLENPTLSPRLQRAWQFVTGRGSEGYVLFLLANCYNGCTQFLNTFYRAEETPEAFSIRQQWYGSITLLGTMLSIVAIELTISWNHITNVYSMSSTGQLIAFVVGLGPLITTVYRVLKEKAVSVCLYRNYKY
jgi:hypothetical protein